jgi:hypothetical protein
MKIYMTHVKNAEAFARIVDFCTGYGGSYNPGRQTLRLESLIAQKQEANLALTTVINARSLFDSEINLRKQTFDQLPRLVSSIMRTLEASGASPEKLEDARMFARQITGSTNKNRPPMPSPEAQTLQTSPRSTLQLAYASKADWFAKLVNAVSTEPLYQANEPHLSLAGLNEKLNQLNMLNQRVSAARVEWSNSLISRNGVLYKGNQSVYRTAIAVKRYVRAIFGLDSGQYAQVKSLRFTKPSRQ